MYRVRLQKVARSNGYVQYYVSLPRRLVEELGWEKGDELLLDIVIIDANTRINREWKGVLIMNPRDCYGAFPEKYCRDRLGTSC
ncbi:MAG: AbrB/MazE/SpoVT family DNA-binding domain-containing protein [Crenarchaeota archaeon]|nr:AbrB/MazE/SpoVT family DNA-binding domain-containing protein [Thermoproteota archaeon]